MSDDLYELLDQAVRAQAMRDAWAIEARLLAGENHIEYDSPAGHRVVLDVPRWRERPIRRLRIEWRRRRKPDGTEAKGSPSAQNVPSEPS